jgi:VWFA-related protein
MMGRVDLCLLLVFALLAMGPAPSAAEDPSREPGQPDQPINVDTVESVRVRLVLLDVLVVDKQGRTVDDLTIDDFEILSDGEVIDVDTLDVACPAGATDDPRGVRHAAKRAPAVAPEVERKIVLAMDYLHLGQTQQAEALDQAMQMVRHGSVEGDKVMVVALNGGMRVEQPFTGDKDEVVRRLRRMQFDVSLWTPDYSHLNENGFVRGMTALLDVLGTVAGQKAVVLFSTMRDVPMDLQFRSLAAHAAASRCSIYPVDVLGLTTATMTSGPAGPAPAPG